MFCLDARVTCISTVHAQGMHNQFLQEEKGSAVVVILHCVYFNFTIRDTLICSCHREYSQRARLFRMNMAHAHANNCSGCD